MLPDSHAHPVLFALRETFQIKRLSLSPFLFASLPLSPRFLTPLSLVIKTPRRDLSQHARVRAKLVAPFGTSCQSVTRHR